MHEGVVKNMRNSQRPKSKWQRGNWVTKTDFHLDDIINLGFDCIAFQDL